MHSSTPAAVVVLAVAALAFGLLVMRAHARPRATAAPDRGVVQHQVVAACPPVQAQLPVAPPATTLRVAVMALPGPCGACGAVFWWVFGLLPVHRPRGYEFVSTDFPAAVALAQQVLVAAPGLPYNIAGHLAPRPVGCSGRGYNPNRCPWCGCQEDWHALEGIVVRAYGEGETRLAEGRVPVGVWRALRGGGMGVAWPGTQ